MDEDAAFTAIIFCPCCCSSLDAEGVGEQEFTCEQCGTEFSVRIIPSVFMEHASV